MPSSPIATSPIVGHTARPPLRPKLRIGFVLAPRFTLIAFAGFIDAIRLAADEGDRSRQRECHWAVLGDGGHPVVSSCGAAVTPWAPMADAADYDYIVVIGGLLHDGQQVFPGTYSFLQSAAERGVPLVGLCTGPFILARAGLLDGYEVCVSWFHKSEFEEEFPDLSVQSDRMFIIDRNRITCAGGTSVVHLAAHLIERHCGRAQALKSLRIMIEEQPLPIGAWQPEEVITRQARDGLVRDVMLRIEQNLGDTSPVSDFARALGVSARQIERRFMNDVGISPREYRARLRLARSKWMVEHTDRSMTDISLECGFTDSAHFSRSFREAFGMRPSDARRIAAA